MIYVSQEQITEVEYLIEQSIQGNHVLFDPDMIRQAFLAADPEKTQAFDEAVAYSMEHHIERIVTLPSLNEKRSYLKTLDPDALHLVVRTYFSLVENNLLDSKVTRH